MAVNVHFNCFIDLTINSHTNPYNLASSRLLWSAQPWHTNGYARIVGFVGRRIFPEYVFLVYTNGTLGDRNFCTLRHRPAADTEACSRTGEKMKNLVPRVGTKINQSSPNHCFWEQGHSQDFSKGGGGGSQRLLTSLSCQPPRPY